MRAQSIQFRNFFTTDSACLNGSRVHFITIGQGGECFSFEDPSVFA